MSMRHAVLGLLARGPRHGYELRAAYEEELVPRAQLNVGQVYATLERLEREGFVTHEVVSQEVRPHKKVFALTPAGRKELGRWFAEPSPPPLELRAEVYVKIALARRIQGVEPLRVIETERKAAFARLHEVTQARGRAHRRTSVEEGLLLELAVFRIEAFVKWLDRCEEALREGGDSP